VVSLALASLNDGTDDSSGYLLVARAVLLHHVWVCGQGVIDSLFNRCVIANDFQTACLHNLIDIAFAGEYAIDSLACPLISQLAFLDQSGHAGNLGRGYTQSWSVSTLPIFRRGPVSNPSG